MEINNQYYQISSIIWYSSLVLYLYATLFDSFHNLLHLSEKLFFTSWRSHCPKNTNTLYIELCLQDRHYKNQSSETVWGSCCNIRTFLHGPRSFIWNSLLEMIMYGVQQIDLWKKRQCLNFTAHPFKHYKMNPNSTDKADTSFSR